MAPLLNTPLCLSIYLLETQGRTQGMDKGQLLVLLRHDVSEQKHSVRVSTSCTLSSFNQFDQLQISWGWVLPKWKCHSWKTSEVNHKLSRGLNPNPGNGQPHCINNALSDFTHWTQSFFLFTAFLFCHLRYTLFFLWNRATVLVLILVLSCCDNLRRQVPLNFIALGLFVSRSATSQASN